MACRGSCTFLVTALVGGAVALGGAWDAKLSLLSAGGRECGTVVCVQAACDMLNCVAAQASASGAYCLDGSPPGFYYRAASSPQALTKWKIHVMGGGWCVSESDCLARSSTLLGSTTSWPEWLSTLWPPEARERRAGIRRAVTPCANRVPPSMALWTRTRATRSGTGILCGWVTAMV